MYSFSKKSKDRAKKVHPLLMAAAEKVLSYGIIDLTVPQYGGDRTEEDQAGLVAKGASKTMNSLHRIQPTGYAHAIDLIPYPVDWNDIDRFKLVGELMKHAARELDFPIEWGGEWPNFKDYPHFQLPRSY